MKKDLSKLLSCRHCGNIARMEIVGTVNDNNDYEDPTYGPQCDSGTNYNVLRCPACEKVNIIRYDWHEMMESDDEISYEFLYPHNSSYPLGLPEKILNAFKRSNKFF